MNINLKKYFKISLVFFIINFGFYNVYGEEENASEILQEIQSIQNDIKTLEKAVYSSDSLTQNINSGSKNFNEDVLTRHLLKLSEIESQFQNLTNKFEEINFKIDKLSNRITKIQRDNQLRFQDLEKRGVAGVDTSGETETEVVKKLPGSDEPQDLGSASSYVETEAQAQKTQSIESVGSVVTETYEREKILPDDSAEKQYEFAISFLKVGDYETAEFALREFVDINPEHKLAGNAQYWYGETFRIRQLYQDAATAYLDGYQKYPKSSKAPVNLLKLGVTLVQIGEKEQGCMMIAGVVKQYPKATDSVLQKAKHEEQKFKCIEAKS